MQIKCVRRSEGKLPQNSLQNTLPESRPLLAEKDDINVTIYLGVFMDLEMVVRSNVQREREREREREKERRRQGRE